jgi:hypothetical protein
MDSQELEPEQQERILQALGDIVASGGEARADSFPLPEQAQRDAKHITNDLLEQKGRHRDSLLNYVRWVAALSFGFLVVVIMLQMIVRIFIPTYTGVSDTVINIITVGVFGQVIAIVAAIAVAVFKDAAEKN